MPVLESELTRSFIVLDEQTTVRRVRDAVQATGNLWTYVIVPLSDGQYAVLWLSEIVQALKAHSDVLLARMLDATLADIPNLLAPRAAAAVQQSTMTTREARGLVKERPGQRLVILEDSEVLGLLVRSQRLIVELDLGWLDQEPEPEEEAAASKEPRRVSRPEKPKPGRKRWSLPMLSPDEEAEPPQPIEPQNRWINAEILEHDPAEPLQMNNVYTLAFDVDTELRDTAVGGGEFRYRFQPDEKLVALTVQLESDDFEIYTDPQRLLVPQTGKSKNKARFDIEPRHEGEGVINAVFLKDGNFVQLMTIRVSVGVPVQPALLTDKPLGRPVDAAFAIRPRDLSMTILEDDSRFRLIMSGAVGAMATLPITLPQLDQMINQVRQELLSIVQLEVGSAMTRVYQTGIEIPAEVNQQALQQLAKAGFRLYQRIFYSPAAHAELNLLGDKLHQMAQEETLKIQVFSQQFVLPWGILYLAEEYDPGNVDPEMFLGLRHIIEHIPLQPGMHVVDREIDSHPGLTVSLNVNADIDLQMGGAFIADQRDYWERIERSGGARVILRKTEDAVRKALADPTTADQLLYFYCHAISKSLAEGGGPDASTLVLSGGERLTLGDLHVFAPTGRPLPGMPLVFINACESAELSPLFYDGFVPYFMAKGARGVIGTECKIPALFAAEWAKRFFDRFLVGGSLGQIALDLRREFFYEHNNLLGLLYALYVDGDTQIVPGLEIA
jgi:hypothetical protein